MAAAIGVDVIAGNLFPAHLRQWRSFRKMELASEQTSFGPKNAACFGHAYRRFFPRHRSP